MARPSRPSLSYPLPSMAVSFLARMLTSGRLMRPPAKSSPVQSTRRELIHPWTPVLKFEGRMELALSKTMIILVRILSFDFGLRSMADMRSVFTTLITLDCKTMCIV